MEGQCIPTLAARPLLQAFVIRTLNVLRIRVDQNGVSDPGQETAIHMSKTNLKLSKSLHFLGHVYRWIDFYLLIHLIIQLDTQ